MADRFSLDDVEMSSPAPGVVRMNHAAHLCAGDVCCVHNPSAHHMRDWPLTFRTDRAAYGADGRVLVLAERICRCGVGHPDPDSVAYLRKHQTRDGYGWGLHGCCGCCREPEGQ